LQYAWLAWIVILLSVLPGIAGMPPYPAIGWDGVLHTFCLGRPETVILPIQAWATCSAHFLKRGSCSIVQVGLKFLTLLPLPPKCWNLGVCHHAWLGLC
jgi:hypothetical protein